jgi:hypothetical protein
VADEKQDAQKQSLWEQVLAKRAEWAKEQPSLTAQLKAMGREALKDVHNTLNQVFFSGHAGIGEPGAPLNPTPQMVTQDLDVMGGYKAMLDGYSTAGPTSQLHDKGMDR